MGRPIHASTGYVESAYTWLKRSGEEPRLEAVLKMANSAAPKKVSSSTAKRIIQRLRTSGNHQGNIEWEMRKGTDPEATKFLLRMDLISRTWLGFGLSSAEAEAAIWLRVAVDGLPDIAQYYMVLWLDQRVRPNLIKDVLAYRPWDQANQDVWNLAIRAGLVEKLRPELPGLPMIKLGPLLPQDLVRLIEAVIFGEKNRDALPIFGDVIQRGVQFFERNKIYWFDQFRYVKPEDRSWDYDDEFFDFEGHFSLNL